MCCNHRAFIEATIACAKLGANSLYLNTAFARTADRRRRLREDPAAVIYDEEFAELIRAGSAGRKRFIAWREEGADDPQAPLDHAAR